jgi:hypothetical protein
VALGAEPAVADPYAAAADEAQPLPRGAAASLEQAVGPFSRA